MVRNNQDDKLKYVQNREVSHPNLIELKKIPSQHNPECANIATVRPLSTKPTKSLIWISARDKRKNSSN